MPSNLRNNGTAPMGRTRPRDPADDFDHLRIHAEQHNNSRALPQPQQNFPQHHHRTTTSIHRHRSNDDAPTMNSGDIDALCLADASSLSSSHSCCAHDNNLFLANPVGSSSSSRLRITMQQQQQQCSPLQEDGSAPPSAAVDIGPASTSCSSSPSLSLLSSTAPSPRLHEDHASFRCASFKQTHLTSSHNSSGSQQHLIQSFNNNHNNNNSAAHQLDRDRCAAEEEEGSAGASSSSSSSHSSAVLLANLETHINLGDVHGAVEALLACSPSGAPSCGVGSMGAPAEDSTDTIISLITSQYRFNWNPKQRETFESAARMCFSSLCDVASSGSLWTSSMMMMTASKPNDTSNPRSISHKDDMDDDDDDDEELVINYCWCHHAVFLFNLSNKLSETVGANATFAASHIVNSALTLLEQQFAPPPHHPNSHKNNNNESRSATIIQHAILRSLLALCPAMENCGCITAACIGRIFVHRISAAAMSFRGVDALVRCGAAALLFTTCWLSASSSSSSSSALSGNSNSSSSSSVALPTPLFQSNCEQTVVKIGISLRSRIVDAKKRAREVLSVIPPPSSSSSSSSVGSDCSSSKPRNPLLLSRAQLCHLSSILHNALESWSHTAPSKRAFANTPLTGCQSNDEQRQHQVSPTNNINNNDNNNRPPQQQQQSTKYYPHSQFYFSPLSCGGTPTFPLSAFVSPSPNNNHSAPLSA